jgi:predicted dehydrogenase
MIGIGVVGYGYWGPNLARCANDADETFLAAIADTSMDALAKAHKRYPQVQGFQNWRDLISNPVVDAVAIATPVHSHFEIALAALKAGKHVLVEKPMTKTSWEAAILIEEAARRDLTLMVDHTFVYTPAVRKIHDLIEQGIVGDLYYYDSTRINLGLIQHDVNVIWDLAVHDLAILDFILEAKPAVISATGSRHVPGKPENTAHITLYYDSGTMAHLNVNWLAPVKVRQTLVGGSNRMIVWDDLEPSEKIKVYDRGVKVAASPETFHDMLISYRTGDIWSPQLSTKEALSAEIEQFAACISDRTQPITSGAAGLRVVEMLEIASQSLAQHGHPVELSPLARAS